MSYKAYNESEIAALKATAEFTQENILTRWITNHGHKTCEQLRQNRSCTLVDLGCGRGDHVPFVKSGDYLGIDICSEMLEAAQIKYPRKNFRKGSIYSIPMESASVKSAIAFGVLEHLDMLDSALVEINRILSPDGEFLFAIPTEGWLYRLGRRITTQRHMEARGVDYLRLLRSEHVNTCVDVLKNIEKSFSMVKCLGVPFYHPSININFVIVGRCVK